MSFVWIKGNRKFIGKQGTKDHYAFDLILMKNIQISKNDCERLDIRNKSSKEINRITLKEASQLLEYKGWKWVKL